MQIYKRLCTFILKGVEKNEDIMAGFVLWKSLHLPSFRAQLFFILLHSTSLFAQQLPSGFGPQDDDLPDLTGLESLEETGGSISVVGKRSVKANTYTDTLIIHLPASRCLFASLPLALPVPVYAVHTHCLRVCR